MDEVKTGFRHHLGGYQTLADLRPDLSVFGKAIANGYPLGAIGGRAEIMELFDADDATRRVMIAGTYNGHPMVMAAASATMRTLIENEVEIYAQLEQQGQQMQHGIETLFQQYNLTATVARQGSAFCAYFMDHAPRDWHDILEFHDFEKDTRYRRALIEEGVYHFPLPTKQGSISTAHTENDIADTLRATERVLQQIQ